MNNRNKLPFAFTTLASAFMLVAAAASAHAAEPADTKADIQKTLGFAVAAQVPCRYCVLAHTEFGKLNGATTAELGEAVAMAAITRHWSTYLNGIQTDEVAFRAEIARIVDNVKKA